MEGSIGEGDIGSLALSGLHQLGVRPSVFLLTTVAIRLLVVWEPSSLDLSSPTHIHTSTSHTVLDHVVLDSDQLLLRHGILQVVGKVGEDKRP